jgi:hypothetical protein
MSAEGPKAPSGIAGRLPLAVEDFALAAWNAGAVPLLALSGSAPILRLGDAPDPVAGWIQLLAVIAAIVAIATRPAGTPLPALQSGTIDARMAFIGPLVFAISFVAGSASTYLGMDLEGPVVGSAFLVIVAAMVLGDRLPTLNAGLRRALLLPFVLVCAGIFDGFAAQLLGDADVPALIASLRVDQTGFGLFVAGMLLAGLAVFYAGLVVAPRALAAPETRSGCLVWPARFALFVVSAVLGIGWLTAVTT